MDIINKFNKKYFEKHNRINRSEILKYSIFAYSLVLSFAFLLICTKTSPLYPFNDWVDSNAFFTMGKGMMNGKILYRDLFEQKGPLLYLIHGISYLISNTTFLGVFIFEVISFSLFLFYCHKLISLFLSAKYSIMSLPLITVIVLNMENFTYGDSAEEFCLPLITISLYYLIDYFKNIYPDLMSEKCILLNGIIAGCVLWIKYSLLGFWFGWMASMFILMIINRNYVSGFRGCFIFLFGMVLATLPWTFYFGLNNSIIPWLETYIYINASCYTVEASFMERLIYVFAKVNISICRNMIFGVLFYYGLIIFIISKNFIKSRLNRVCLFFCIFLLSLGVYGGGRGHIYYFLIFSPFVVFGFIRVMDLLRIKFDRKISFRASITTAIIFVIIAFPLTLLFNNNTSMLKVDKQNLVQYKFASIINQTEDATLLNYGYLDYGFFTASNITPNIRFFENQNIDYSRFPIIMDEQNRYIKDKVIDYVVLGLKISDDTKNLNIPYLYENYTLIKEDTQIFESKEYKFILFKVK